MSESMVLDAILRDIRAKCADCMGGHRNLVAACDCVSCSLHKYRLTRAEKERLVIPPGAEEPVGEQLDMEKLIAG